jgi:transposase
LERGRFASLFRDDGKVIELTSSELALFIEGCELVGKRMLSPSVVKPKVLALDRAV